MTNTTPADSTAKEPTSTNYAASTPLFSHEQLRDALMFAEDIFERADMPFFVWDETLDRVVNDEAPLTGLTSITIAVVKAEWTKEHVSILEHWGGRIVKFPREIDKPPKERYMIQGTHDIPIVVHIIQGQYDFLKHPDTKHYWIEEFKVPNPLSTYFKMRDSIV